MEKKVNEFGFTLLEMVVVIGILSVLLGTGMATITSFKERRELLSDARSLASLLKQTQVKAGAVEIPGGCEASGVGEFVIDFSGSEASLLVNDPSGATCDSSNGILNLSNGAEFNSPGSVVFKTPFGSANPMTISIHNYGIQYNLEIGENGSVSEPKEPSHPMPF